MDAREGEKGHRELIRILPAVKRDVPDVQLVCAGPGDDRHALQQLARHHGLRTPYFFRAMCLWVPCRRYTGIAMPWSCPAGKRDLASYLEAMQHAKPCVGCFHQGAEDIIAHGETGLLVHDPADAPSLLGALNTLLQDRTYAQWLGQNGYKRLQREFTARHYQARLKAHITGLLD